MSLAGLHRHASRQWTVRSTRRLFSTRSEHAHDPLRILFCGADAFSIDSLRALDAFKSSHTSKVESIEVVCRPDKNFGHGFKSKQAVPIKSVANDLGLKLHQLDTFDDRSFDADLIVTASFGLLVPARLLHAAQYGGLNVHPSLLPDLRGAAPIQHALLHRMEETGISIQTMHPTKFDHGLVLAQEKVDLSKIRHSGMSPSTQDVVDELGPVAADLLVKSIDQGLFIGRVPVQSMAVAKRKAPKITPADRKIDWQTWTAEEFIVRSQALGQLWDTECFSECGGGASETRMTFEGPWRSYHAKHVKIIKEKWKAVLLTDQQQDSRSSRRVAFRAADGGLIAPASVSIAGKAKGTGLETLQRLLERRDHS